MLAGTAVENNLVIDLSGFLVAIDGDGDSLALPNGSFVINVTDDIPVDFMPKDAFVLNASNAMSTLDLEFAEAVGADELGDVVIRASISDTLPLLCWAENRLMGPRSGLPPAAIHFALIWRNV